MSQHYHSAHWLKTKHTDKARFAGLAWHRLVSKCSARNTITPLACHLLSQSYSFIKGLEALSTATQKSLNQPFIMSRSTVLSHMSQSVTGTFLLHDQLSISTMSGSINITVIPQPASSAKAPAKLRLSTASGAIKVVMAPFLNDPSTMVPERIFDSSIKSMSGSITAALIQ